MERWVSDARSAAGAMLPGEVRMERRRRSAELSVGRDDPCWGRVRGI